MKDQKSYTPVLMYVDHTKIDASIKKATVNAESINSQFKAVERFLEKDLTDDELMELGTKGIDFVDEVMKERFQFPNAAFDFNLEAMGLTQSYAELKGEIKDINRLIKSYPFNIKEGNAYLPEEAKKEITQANTHYTKNQAQNDALGMAKRMTKDLNKAIDKKFISRWDFHSITKSLFFLDEKGGEFFINYRKIKLIPENGGTPSYY